MNYTTITSDGEFFYQLPIGDIHFGSKHFGAEGKKKLKGYLDWMVAQEGTARAFLMGDVFEIATRASKSTPFETTPSEVEDAADFFKPYAQYIDGAIEGNHELRINDYAGWSPTKIFCKLLDIPYMGLSCVMKIQVGKRNDSNSYHNTYYTYAHHTTGGGELGNSLNRIMRLEKIVEGCDVYLGGHNHQLVTGVRSIFRPTISKIVQRKVSYASCGSYLDYAGSYAEKGMYPPSKLGSPRIRYSGERDKHDCHISI